MKKKSLLLLVPSLLTAVLVSSCLLSCTAINRFVRPVQDETVSDNGFRELLEAISDRYIGDYDESELVVQAKRAIVDSLDDNWSYYMTPDEYAQYLVSSENTYHGIGVEVLIDENAGGIYVTNVFRNSGAYNAGIVPGDIITAVDGVSIQGFTLLEVRGVLRRPLDDTALLTVLHQNGHYEDLVVVYSVIFQDPVSFELLDNGIGYIYLRNFEGSSADGFISAVEELISQGATAFIYDVRSNNGGRVNEMTKILDFLLSEGEIFISVDETGTESIITSDAEFTDFPAVVLVNSHSYSGAEYFTAALSEYGYAVTVGEHTTGKNRMQSTIPLSDGGALHISTGMFLTPNRVDLFLEGGYEPDYPVEMTEEQLAMYYSGVLTHDEDPQLQKAIELLR